MPTTEMNKLELLAQHYEKTFELQKGYSSKRDRLFLYILVVICVMILYTLTPAEIGGLINSFIQKQVAAPAQTLVTTPATGAENTIVIDVSFIGTVLWFALMSITHTYFQTVLHIERQYKYIYILEDQLSAFYGRKAFTREGKHYQGSKSAFSGLTKFIFWVSFPVLLFAFVVFWMFFLFRVSGASVIYLIINSVIAFVFLLSGVLYLLALHRKK